MFINIILHHIRIALETHVCTKAFLCVLPVQQNFFFLWLKLVKASKQSPQNNKRYSLCISHTSYKLLLWSPISFLFFFSFFSQPCNKNEVQPRCITELTQCVINVLAAVIHLSLCRRCSWHRILYSFFMSPTSWALYFVLHFVTDVLGTTFYPSLCHWRPLHYSMPFIMSLMSLALWLSLCHWCPWHYIMSIIMSLTSLAQHYILHFVTDS